MGDVFLSAGLAFFLFATVVRSPQELDEAEMELVRRRLEGITGKAPAAAAAPTGILGETGITRRSAQAATRDGTTTFGGAAAPPIAEAPAIPDLAEQARRHPFVRLALNGSFSALWAGQLISLFGDRIHQIALAFLVFDTTDNVIAVAAVFLAATLPNLLFGPIAGTFVDRWDHREVLIVSDLLRAALVLLLPVAAVTNLLLVYPLIFLITTISVFFRPARVAILPRIVREDELLTANSALWIGETVADIIGYPLAGLFVAFLGTPLPLAFWLDAGTYVASAALISTIVVPPIGAAGVGCRREAGFVGEMSRAGGSCAARPRSWPTRCRRRSPSSRSASSSR